MIQPIVKLLITSAKGIILPVINKVLHFKKSPIDLVITILKSYKK